MTDRNSVAHFSKPQRESQMSAKVKSYAFYSDPGHGWLKVAVADLVAAKIDNQITGYSYRSRDGKFAYLEEDCDAPRFLNAIGYSENRDRFKIVSHVNRHRDSFVRKLPHYV
jgi:hypothetical protein